ncbi:hypothetical protein PIB30_077209 [Stylosanthes scabra]|uniref:Uncharacterized protein n=1 Tax=Stylosanthes scabra TaxID=79078 RepID=A0ABU6XNT6_9FABA|nr:hypothetical protein [Stylosanthes scabra]
MGVKSCNEFWLAHIRGIEEERSRIPHVQLRERWEAPPTTHLEINISSSKSQWRNAVFTSNCSRSKSKLVVNSCWATVGSKTVGKTSREEPK